MDEFEAGGLDFGGAGTDLSALVAEADVKFDETGAEKLDEIFLSLSEIVVGNESESFFCFRQKQRCRNRLTHDDILFVKHGVDSDGARCAQEPWHNELALQVSREQRVQV